MTRRWHLIGAALLLAGCAATPAADRPEVALGAPPAEAARPVDGAELAAATTYRFPDLLPGTLDLEIDDAPAGLYPVSTPSVVYLGGDAAGLTDVAVFAAADQVSTFVDPLRRESEGLQSDVAEFVGVPPGGLLDRFAAQRFLEVTAAERETTIAGVPARAIDVRVPEFPSGTEPCGPGGPLCADLWTVGGMGQAVLAGQELRIAELALPAGPVMLVQNLLDPRAETVLDRLRFVERELPPELAGARLVPVSARPLDPGATYGAVLADVGIGVSFVTGDVPTAANASGCLCVIALAPDLPDDLRETGSGYRSSTELVFGLVSPTAEQLVPEPGVDPRLVGPAAFEASTGAGAGGADGIVGVIAGQPWADVLTGPVDTVVGGHPARTIEVRLRPGTGTVPCRVDRPEDGLCAIPLYTRGVPGMLVLSDRVLRMSQVQVGDVVVTVVTSLDEAGERFARSLRLVEVPTR